MKEDTTYVKSSLIGLDHSPVTWDGRWKTDSDENKDKWLQICFNRLSRIAQFIDAYPYLGRRKLFDGAMIINLSVADCPACTEIFRRNIRICWRLPFATTKLHMCVKSSFLDYCLKKVTNSLYKGSVIKKFCCFLCCYTTTAVDHQVELSVISDTITLTWRYCHKVLWQLWVKNPRR